MTKKAPYRCTVAERVEYHQEAQLLSSQGQTNTLFLIIIGL